MSMEAKALMRGAPTVCSDCVTSDVSPRAREWVPDNRPTDSRVTYITTVYNDSIDGAWTVCPLGGRGVSAGEHLATRRCPSLKRELSQLDPACSAVAYGLRHRRLETKRDR